MKASIHPPGPYSGPSQYYKDPSISKCLLQIWGFKYLFAQNAVFRAKSSRLTNLCCLILFSRPLWLSYHSPGVRSIGKKEFSIGESHSKVLTKKNLPGKVLTRKVLPGKQGLAGGKFLPALRSQSINLPPVFDNRLVLFNRCFELPWQNFWQKC